MKNDISTETRQYVLDKKMVALMKEKSMTMAELSRRSGVPIKTLYHWTAGQRPSNIEKVFAVANVLGVEIENLVFDHRPLETVKSEKTFELIILKISEPAANELLRGISNYETSAIARSFQTGSRDQK